MNSQRPVILVMLVIYIFLPSFLSWVTNPQSAWYKPFIVWAFLILVTAIVQLRKTRNDI